MAMPAGQYHTFNEKASKIGHIEVLKSEWVKSLLDDFYTDDVNDETIYDNSIWVDYNLDETNDKELEHIWVVDGSYVEENSNKKELVYIKAALLNINQNKIDDIDVLNPHPMKLQKIMSDSALFHATVLPLRNLKSKRGNIYDTVRNIIYDSLKLQDNGIFYETYKWLIYKKWNNLNNNSPAFECPFCGKKIDDGMPYDSDKYICPYCNNELLSTDILGFHLDMDDDYAKLKVGTSYMTIIEHLMLFTVIRHNWNLQSKDVLSNTLYIKDGPMILGGQYAKLVPLIREMLEFAKQDKRPIHIIGVEKTGEFVDFLSNIAKFNKVDDNHIKCAILSHQYIREKIKRIGKFDPSQKSPYGFRTNWGEKAFVILDNYSHFVLNLTTGNYYDDENEPNENQIIGIMRILKTLPKLISRKYDGAIYPIELANGIASMSNYPSSKILERFTESNIK